MPSVLSDLVWTTEGPAERFVLIDQGVANSLSQNRQSTRDCPERGGLLIGYRRGDHFDVIAITLPMLGDRQTRTRFSRLDQGHQKAMGTHWKESGHTADYLGEWHTHPEAKPLPSSLDRREWNKIVARSKLPMLFLIVGTDDWYVELSGRGPLCRIQGKSSE